MFVSKIEVPTPVSVAHTQRELAEVALDNADKGLKWQEVKLNGGGGQEDWIKGECVAVAMSHRPFQNMPISQRLRGLMVR